MLRQSNPVYPCHYESRCTLSDGRAVMIRPIWHTDSKRLVELFAKLSPDSRYRRFLVPLGTLPDDLLFRLTHIDYRKNFALVAVTGEADKGAIIAVARYCTDPCEKQTDFAIVVHDDWQGCGLGGYLLSKIIAAGREQGIPRFISIIDSTNRTIKQILRKGGCKVRYSYGKGFTQVELFL